MQPWPAALTLLLLLLTSTASSIGLAPLVGQSPISSASSHDEIVSGSIGGSDPGRCTPVPIEVPMCMENNVVYNTTAQVVPVYSKQSDAAIALKQFDEFVRVPCAPFLRLFVCSMHLPLCASLLVRPCKEFCLRIQELCSPVLLHFGHSWPQSLRCDDLLPEWDKITARRNLCLRPGGFDQKLAKMRSSGELAMGTASDGIKTRKEDEPLQPPMPPSSSDPSGEAAIAEAAASASTIPAGAGNRPPQRLCTRAEVKLGHDPSGVACAQRCHASFLFSREDKAFASVWMLIWSVICFVCSALAVVTFAMDSSRFPFPERPIVWVSGCYLLFSLGHILRAALGPELACSQVDGPGTASELYRVSRHAGHWCAVIFLLLYFSSLAGCLWWLLLTVSWYLCAARKWAHEALAHRTVWLHVFAWGIPLVLSVVLLVLHRIEADELTHLCVVDASNRTNILVFSIAPTVISLLVGVCFLVSALCSSVSVRHSLKWSGNASFRRLEKLMTKISLFSFLFVLPTVCVVAANAYEFLEREKWTASVEKLLTRPACVNASGLLTSTSDCSLDARPSSTFYMLKIFLSLAAGLPSGLVVWFNCKSLSAWQTCLLRILTRHKRQGQQQQQQQLQQHEQLWKLTATMPSPGLHQPKSPSADAGVRRMLLTSGQSKYPPINGIGTTDI